MSESHKGSIRNAWATRRTHPGRAGPLERHSRRWAASFLTTRPDTPKLRKTPSYGTHGTNKGLQQDLEGARPSRAHGARARCEQGTREERQALPSQRSRLLGQKSLTNGWPRGPERPPLKWRNGDSLGAPKLPVTVTGLNARPTAPREALFPRN